jgi:hypothetical protein
MIQGVHSADAFGILTSLLPQVPFALVAVAGLWYAVATRKRHARVSLLATIAFACLAASIAIRAAIQLLLVGGSRPASMVELANQLALWSSLAAGLLLVSLVLLAVAAFLPR